MTKFESLASILFIILCLLGISAWLRRKLNLCFRSANAARAETAELRDLLLRSRVAVKRLGKSFELVQEQLECSQRSPQPVLRSQFGEDMVLLAFFGSKMTGFYVEAGGYDGLTFSATAVLESLGWKGLLVEPHPQLFASCVRNRPGSVVKQVALGSPGESGSVDFTCVDYQSGAGSPLSFRSAFADQAHIDRCLAEGANFTTTKVAVATLNATLDGLTERVDVLVLDIEGHELRVLEGFDIRRYRPAVVLVEVHWSDADQIVRNWFVEREYASCGVIGCNEFFAPNIDAERLRALVAAFPDC